MERGREKKKIRERGVNGLQKTNTDTKTDGERDCRERNR